MSSPPDQLTPEEIKRVRAQWAREDRAAQNTHQSSKPSFVSWLQKTGLTWIANKIFDLTWPTIKEKFGLMLQELKKLPRK
jgi:hypothetical protein